MDSATAADPPPSVKDFVDVSSPKAAEENVEGVPTEMAFGHVPIWQVSLAALVILGMLALLIPRVLRVKRRGTKGGKSKD